MGGLPKKMKLQLVEPLKELFKDEVRILGKSLGLDNLIIKKHPFPGPGLAIRIVGKITHEKIKILQNADDIFIKSLIKNTDYIIKFGKHMQHCYLLKQLELWVIQEHLNTHVY